MVGCCYDYETKLYVMHFLSKMTCFYKSFPMPHSEFRTGKTQLSHTLCGKSKNGSCGNVKCGIHF